MPLPPCPFIGNPCCCAISNQSIRDYEKSFGPVSKNQTAKYKRCHCLCINGSIHNSALVGVNIVRLLGGGQPAMKWSRSNGATAARSDMTRRTRFEVEKRRRKEGENVAPRELLTSCTYDTRRPKKKTQYALPGAFVRGARQLHDSKTAGRQMLTKIGATVVGGRSSGW